MNRNLAVAGGRQVKNEDFTQYIQAFTLFEGLYGALSHGLFILQGVVFTPNGGNFDITAGVIYADGELCLFDAVVDVALPYKTTKNRIGINPREFQDTVTRNTGEAVKLQFDALGTVILDQDTPRATDKFLRTANGFLRAPIDGNNNDFSNVWKSLLSDSVEMVRQIPKPTGVDRYLKLGEFPINETQLSHFVVTGLEPNSGTIANLTIKRTKLTPDDNALGVITYVGGESANRPTYYLKRNDTSSKYELWAKSPATIPSGELTSGVIRLISEDFTDIEDSFVFESNYLWSATIPTSLVAFSEVFPVVSSERFEKKRFDIGDWDMDTNNFAFIIIDIPRANIKSVDVLIHKDTGDFTRSISYISSSGQLGGGYYMLDDGINTKLEMTRVTGGFFDSIDYNAIGYNRGEVLITYTK